MELRTQKDSDIDNWKEVMLIYNSALKQISTKLEILNDEFQHVHRYNPIEHIKSRVKTSESIVKNMKTTAPAPAAQPAPAAKTTPAAPAAPAPAAPSK